MALENNLVVDSDAELKAFLSSILSSEGIVVNINRTFIAYNNGTNRNRVFARCANRMAQKGTDEKFVVIALMCYPALNWILKARDIDAMIEQLHDMDTDGSVRNISEIQSLLENSTGYVKPRLHLEMRKLFFARCQQLVDAVDDAMNRAVFRSAQPCKPARISLAMAMLRGSILDSDPVSAVMIRNNFDGIIEDIAKVGGEAIRELVLQLAPNEGVVQGAEAAYLYHNTEVLLREYSRITHPSSVDGNSTLRLIATAGNQLDASDHKSDARYAQAQILLQYAKLIGGAIELLKQFPDGDSKLYDVLMLVINEKYNDYPNFCGRLHIPAAGVDVALYNNTDQETCNREDSACVFPKAPQDGGSNIVADNEIPGLTSVTIGSTAYVITPSGEQINYVCVDACDGHNDVTGFDALQKNDGTVVWGSADLIVYTCLSDAYNVRIVCFNRA